MNSRSVNSLLAIALNKQWLKPERHGGRQSFRALGWISVSLLDIRP